MGQKVNPTFFRLGNTSFPETSIWQVKKTLSSHLFSQDYEIKRFIENLLKARGIVLRSFQIVRFSNKLYIVLDLYFSYLLTKGVKFFWAKLLFKSIKKKYEEINRIKDIKNFSRTLEDYGVLENSGVKKNVKIKYKNKLLLGEKKTSKNLRSKKILKNFLFLKKKKAKFVKKRLLRLKASFYFFLLVKKNKNLLIPAKDTVLYLNVIQNYRRKYALKPDFVKLSFLKFKKFFALKKFRYNFRNFHLKNSFVLFAKKQNSQALLSLNKDICNSLYKFLGIEHIEIKTISTQFHFLPVFKFYKKVLLKELFSFQRNREISKYFFEIQENLFFVMGTYGSGNARLLAKLLVFLFENIKKQTIIVRFLKKSLEFYFKKFDNSFLAIDGIRILIKGRFNKRRRTKKIVLQQGQVSLQTINAPIDYYQTQAITIYGSFGIKVWLAKKL